MAQERKAELKDRLKEALTAANMKPIQLSEITGIPKSMLSYYLNGKTKPKADRIYKISKALNVSEAWLLGYDVPQVRTAEQKKNDNLVMVIAKMRQDPKFLEVVLQLADLPEEQYEAVKNLLRAMAQR